MIRGFIFPLRPQRLVAGWVHEKEFSRSGERASSPDTPPGNIPDRSKRFKGSAGVLSKTIGTLRAWAEDHK